MGQTLEKCAHTQHSAPKQLERSHAESSPSSRARHSSGGNSSPRNSSGRDVAGSAVSITAASEPIAGARRSAQRSESRRTATVRTGAQQASEARRGLASPVSRKAERSNKTNHSVGFSAGSPEPPPPPPLIPRPGIDVYNLLDEDDVDNSCPICLESYSHENPRIVAFCGHAFHLGCIYEWMERSPYCAICARAMQFSELASTESERVSRETRSESDSSWTVQSDSDHGRSLENALAELGIDTGDIWGGSVLPPPPSSSSSVSNPVKSVTVTGDVSQSVPEQRQMLRRSFSRQGLLTGSHGEINERANDDPLAVETVEMQDLIQWDEEHDVTAPELVAPAPVTGLETYTTDSKTCAVQNQVLEAQVR
jgi:Rieske Fe-S protein